ncbi:MAG: transcriptional repressor [Acidimicrobiales bacterium]|nr:transcriptional repressor [Acidimicrobiales bacterium]
MTTEIHHVERDLRAAGLRCTAPRVAVLSELRAAPRHWRVDDLAAAVRGRLGRVSTQAVYDVLDVLEARGLARRVQPAGPAGSAARFEARTTDHHHAVCRECGAIADLEPPVRAARRPPEVPDGFVAETVELTVWGRCAACAGDHPDATAADVVTDPEPNPNPNPNPDPDPRHPTDAEEAAP